MLQKTSLELRRRNIRRLNKNELIDLHDNEMRTIDPKCEDQHRIGLMNRLCQLIEISFQKERRNSISLRLEI